MKRLYTIVTLALLITQLFSQHKITPPLQAELERALENNSMVRTLIVLDDHVDILSLDKQLYAEKTPLSERATQVITTLREKAAETQGELLNFLENQPAESVTKTQSFWIANIIAVEALPSVIYGVSERSDVGYIHLDGLLELDRPVEKEAAAESIPNGVESGLTAINAHLMWQAGYTGNGVIVMGMDTGVDIGHPALSYKWRGNHVPWYHAWFDPNTSTTSPTDCDNHGTHTIGTMTGLDPATNDTIGVAPGAEWMAAKTICSSPHTSNSIAAFQWAVDPDTNAFTTDDMPAAIGNSWWDPSISTQCDAGLNPYINVIAAVEAAGIGVIFSAGNSGSGASTITSPKNVNISEVHFFATGALDASNNIASFSSRGPVIAECTTGNTSLDIKPEVSAPGVSVRSAIIGTGYSNFSGTSMACPHVVGAIALLREAHPNRTGLELKTALYNTATDLGAAGEDNNYGMGIINVWAAHQSLADADDPNPPTNFSAYSDFNTPTSVLLDWTDPTTYVNGDPLTSFTIDVYRDGALVGSANSGDETFTDNSLTDGQEYEYTIYAKDSNDSLSNGANASVFAGGSPIPNPPTDVSLTDDLSKMMNLKIRWTNPSTNVDGTPMDDLAAIRLYESGSLLTTFNRTSADSGKADSAIFTPSAGAHTYHLTVVDNEGATNESAASATAFPPLSIPFFDDFPTTPDPNAAYWINTTAEVNTVGVNPTSAPNVLSLDGNPTGGETVTTHPIDLNGRDSDGIILAFWYQPQGTGNAPETPDSFAVDFLNDLDQWRRVRGWPGTGQAPFVNDTITVADENAGAGATFFHDQFQFRFRNIGTQSTTSHFDHWLIDDVFFGPPPSVPGMIDISIPDTLAALPGASIDVPVYLTVGNDSVGAMGAAVKATNGILSYTGYTAGPIVPGASFNINAPATDSVRIGFFNTGGGPITQDGLLATLHFQVDGGATGGQTSQFLFSDLSAAGPLGDEITLNGDNGLFTALSTLSISGTVLYSNGSGGDPAKPVSGLMADLLQNGSTLQSGTTGSSGDYSFMDLPPGGDYRTEISKADGGDASVITPIDALLTYNAFLGTVTFSGAQNLAGDVDSSLAVNPTDALLIFNRYLGITNAFAIDDWRIFPGSYDIDASANAWTTAPDGINYTNLSTNQSAQDFYALIRGDVNFEWTPPAAPPLAANEGEEVTPQPKSQVQFKIVAAPIPVNSEVATWQVWLAGAAANDGIYALGADLQFNSEYLAIQSVRWSDIVPTQDYQIGYNTIQENASDEPSGEHPDATLRIGAFATAQDAIQSDGMLMEVTARIVQEIPAGAALPILISNISAATGISNSMSKSSGKKQLSGFATLYASGESASLKIAELPKEFALQKNYPNPFNPITNIRYQLPEKAKVNLIVYNTLGQKVATLVNAKSQEAGYYEAQWQGKNQFGASVASGIYFYRFEAIGASKQFVKTEKMMLLK